MDPLRGCDYSHARPTKAQLDRDQLSFAVRYIIDKDRDKGKRLQLPEAQQLTSWGRKIVCNFEFLIGRMSAGYAAGVEDAKTSLAEMRYLGVPKGRPCYFSDDTGSTPASAVVAYLRGAASVMTPAGYETGVYGGLNTITTAYNAGFRWLWQTYAWSTRNGLVVWHPETTLRQVRNNAFSDWSGDLDYAQVSDFGQWDTDGNTSQEDDMGALDEVIVIGTDIANLSGNYVQAGQKIPLGRFLQLIFSHNERDFQSGLANKKAITAVAAEVHAVNTELAAVKELLLKGDGDPDIATFVAKIEEEANKTRLYAEELIKKDKAAETKQAKLVGEAWLASIVE